MRSLSFAFLLFSLTACAQGCAVTKALYSAVVHGSGAPSREERALIDRREQLFLHELPRRRLVILPVAILGRVVRYDTVTARAIAEQLRSAGLGAPEVASASLPIPFSPQPNEAAIFWSRFRAFADSVRVHQQFDADYVLLVDLFGAPERGSIAAVHAMVVTTRGDMAYRGAWNSHQRLYREFKPTTSTDAARMVAADMVRRSRSVVALQDP